MGVRFVGLVATLAVATLFFSRRAIASDPLPTAAMNQKSPNILMIVADDLGIGDLKCYGNSIIETPAIDALAAEGVRLTSYYSPSPLCAPARAALLTGRFNHRSGAVDVPGNRGLDRIALSQKTFGKYFQERGYRTALIGKWHNGAYCRDFLPHQRGFDEFIGFANGGQHYWQWNLLRNDAPFSHDGRYLTDVLNDEAIRVIREQTQSSQPFAIFLAHHAPHSPLLAPDDLVQRYRQRLGPDSPNAVAVVYAMIESMDRGLGQVFSALRDEGLWDQTIIVFTSDNGAFLGRDAELGSQMRFHAGYSGNKGDIAEQGIRVPAIVAWPGHIPAGKVVDTPVHGCDWLPTLLATVDAGETHSTNTQQFDGVDLMPLLLGTGSLPDRALFFQRNRYAPVRHVNAAVREGHWKLLWPGSSEPLKKDSGRDNPSYLRGIVKPHWEMPLDRQLDEPTSTPQPAPRLYDLAIDPGEQHDLSDTHPDVVHRLSQTHDAWFDDVMRDWRQSRDEIVDHDRRYWSNRPVPDAAELFDGFWQWKAAPRGTDPLTANPLHVFRGYWSEP
ncbi:MAG: sulfatase-like hydrolase/transferase [Planctomycetaceae bacterium]|nr:sulfatase-like hydrolase/transferase [Planctomycetaceae bacterium]